MSTGVEYFIAHSVSIAARSRGRLLKGRQDNDARVNGHTNRANDAHERHDAQWVAEQGECQETETEGADYNSEGKCG